MSEIITLDKSNPVARLCAYGTTRRLPEHVDAGITTNPDGSLSLQMPQHEISIDLNKLNLSGQALNTITSMTAFTLTQDHGYSLCITLAETHQSDDIASTIRNYLEQDTSSQAQLQEHGQNPTFISVIGSATDLVVLLNTIKVSNFGFAHVVAPSAEEGCSSFDVGPIVL